jgi:hypothetical protein
MVNDKKYRGRFSLLPYTENLSFYNNAERILASTKSVKPTKIATIITSIITIIVEAMASFLESHVTFRSSA